MQYLNTTLTLLKQQNQQLQQKINQKDKLNQLLHQQIECHSKKTIQEDVHDKQLEIVRQINNQCQERLKADIKNLRKEIHSVMAEGELEAQKNSYLKQQVIQLKQKNQQLVTQHDIISQHLTQSKLALKTLQSSLQTKYQHRQSQIMQNYTTKLESLKQQQQQQQQAINFKLQQQILKYQNLSYQKQVLENQVKKLSSILNQSDIKSSKKIEQFKKMVKDYKNENYQLKGHIKQMEYQLFQKQIKIKEGQVRVHGLEKSLEEMNRKNKQNLTHKENQLLKQRTKSKKIIDTISTQKKYMSLELDKSIKKQKRINQDKKQLIKKVKEVEEKYQSNLHNETLHLSCIINQKTKNKKSASTSKNTLDSFNSISLQNSMLGKENESPVVSSFRLDDKEKKIKNKNKLEIKKKNNLKLDEQINFLKEQLKLSDLDTPCFELKDENPFKRTIKLNKK